MRMPASSARSCSRLSRALQRRLAAARRSGRARRGGRRRCRYGASAARRPTGSAAREKYSAGETARPRSNAQAAFTTDGSVGLLVRRDRCDQGGDVEGRVGQRRQHGAQIDRRDRAAGRPAGSPRRRGGRAGRARPARRAPGRSRAAGSGSVITAVPPPARTASAISASPQATATGPISASRPRSSTCTIIGLPWMSASGLPGRRVDAMREGMTTIGFTCGGFTAG